MNVQKTKKEPTITATTGTPRSSFAYQTASAPIAPTRTSCSTIRTTGRCETPRAFRARTFASSSAAKAARMPRSSSQPQRSGR
jgi:hypothetical protein